MEQVESPYQSKIVQWEKHSSVRSRPRRILVDEEDPGFFFPPVRQPILVHPLLASIEPSKKAFILTQSLYKYMNDIANIEKDIINNVALKINKNLYFFKFEPSLQLDALSVIIDESYHAYVALDFMQQVEAFSQMPSLSLPSKTELSLSIKKIEENLPSEMVENFELIAVCIAEHALTNELIATAKAKDVCKTFYYVMHDHVLDENRHAKLFEHVLKKFWEKLPQDHRIVIGPQLPCLINNYLAPHIQKDFDECILKAIGISTHDIQTILDDTHSEWKDTHINQKNIIASQMIDLLKRTDILKDENVKKAFLTYGVSEGAFK